MRADLELLKDMLKDDKVHFRVAKVDQVEVTSSFAKARCLCKVFPEQYEVVAEVAWPSAGPNAGVMQLPVKDDLVTVAFTSDDSQEPFIVGRLSSKTDFIPYQVALGHLLLKSLSGKKTYVGSDTGVMIGKNGLLDPDEPLVLGNVLLDCLTDLYDKVDTILQAIITGPVAVDSIGGSCATHPTLAAALTAQKTLLIADKAAYVTAPLTNVVSQIAFTERGL